MPFKFIEDLIEIEKESFKYVKDSRLKMIIALIAAGVCGGIAIREYGDIRYSKGQINLADELKYWQEFD